MRTLVLMEEDHAKLCHILGKLKSAKLWVHPWHKKRRQPAGDGAAGGGKKGGAK